MARTVRRGRLVRGKVRDGAVQYVSVLCHHHGWCPWCRSNRTFSLRRIAARAADELKSA